MLALVSYFFGGAFAANAVPHLLNGLSGRSFPTPFASPPGKGESSAVTNVLWGAANLVAAWLLLYQAGMFNLLHAAHAGSAGAGALAMALLLARHFGSLYDGNRAKPRRQP